MSRLEVTLIDVGWGDSIFIRHERDDGEVKYALVDSNDSSISRSSYLFLKKHFQREGVKASSSDPVFDFVMLSHAHADHGNGLKAIVREFGTKHFWYSKSNSDSPIMGEILRFCASSSRVSHHEALNNGKRAPEFGDVSMAILWPPHNQIHANENNNSIVFTLTLGAITFVLTGDAEGEVWETIANQIPQNSAVFKVPHHGSENGSLFRRAPAAWFNALNPNAHLGVSSHISPHKHPHASVIQLFNNAGRSYFRTDEHYHITFITDGVSVDVKYSHI